MKYILIVLLAFSINVLANELPKKLVMPTDVGKIVITVEPCKINYGKQKVPFKYHAYATEFKNGMELIHPGCWYRDEMSVNIHFPEIDSVATYNPSYFRDEGFF